MNGKGSLIHDLIAMLTGIACTIASNVVAIGILL